MYLYIIIIYNYLSTKGVRWQFYFIVVVYYGTNINKHNYIIYYQIIWYTLHRVYIVYCIVLRNTGDFILTSFFFYKLCLVLFNKTLISSMYFPITGSNLIVFKELIYRYINNYKLVIPIYVRDIFSVFDVFVRLAFWFSQSFC